MNWRERVADWISGRQITFAKEQAYQALLRADLWMKNCASEKARTDQAIARYEAAVKREEDAENRVCQMLASDVSAKAALRSILTARNITEARKIARQALGEAE